MTQQHQLLVQRTARYFTLGELHAQTKRVWFVCHGYGQLAEHFIRRFDILDDGSTFVVAPEALSRFYVGGVGSNRVGASWMTKEDRLTEIQDYVTYLDTLYRTVLGEIDTTQLQITLLGFSQGTATVCRWAAHGKIRFDRLILWAGAFPHDLEQCTAKSLLQNADPVIVFGNQDEYLSEEKLARHLAELRPTGILPRVIRFEGKHEIVREVLLEVSR